MKIDHLRIHNYKSLVDFELVKPNPFTVFVGPNASGKSNIFEALEFLSYIAHLKPGIGEAFGGNESYINFHFYEAFKEKIRTDVSSIINPYKLIEFDFDNFRVNLMGQLAKKDKNSDIQEFEFVRRFITDDFMEFFSRIYLNKSSLIRVGNYGNSRLQIDASNLEPVLKRILKNEVIQEEFIELCELFIPEFENISVHSDNISGIDTLLIKEKFTNKPFTKNLLSDGTFNILALLTAVYQSDEPQFLCIEEPENGLNPYVIKELVNFFREMCKEKGHMIWLNTHSQTLVSQLEPHEMILIDKKEGITKAKQVQDFDRHDLTMDEAWLSNAIGGGLPW